MKSKKIGIGIIGCGNISQNYHIPEYIKREDVELTAVCDHNIERAKQLRKNSV